MTAMKHIRGMLAISNPEVMNGVIHDTILRAAVNYGLGLIITNVSPDGTINIDSHSTAFGGRNSALEFIDRLTAVLNEGGVAELQLTGSILITVTSDAEPVVFRLTVEKGVVYREEAALVWEKKVENPYLS
jgi:hypothetical protein